MTFIFGEVAPATLSPLPPGFEYVIRKDDYVHARDAAGREFLVTKNGCLITSWRKGADGGVVEARATTGEAAP